MIMNLKIFQKCNINENLRKYKKMWNEIVSLVDFKHYFVCIDIRQSRQKIDIGFDSVKAELINTY